MRGTPRILLGRHSFHGWWYFFPVALAVKTPLAILLAGGCAGLRNVRREAAGPLDAGGLDRAILLVNLPTSLNIGVRYMLPLFRCSSLTGGHRRGVALAPTALGRRRPTCVDGRFQRRPRIPITSPTSTSSPAAHPERILVDSDLGLGPGHDAPGGGVAAAAA